MKDNEKMEMIKAGIMQLRGKQIMIAEFMGGKLDPNDDSVVIFKTHFGNHVFPIDELDYDESWDMLMPVVKQCRIDSRSEHDEDIFWDAIHWSLEECCIKKTYEAVVEFIYDKL